MILKVTGPAILLAQMFLQEYTFILTNTGTLYNKNICLYLEH